MNSSSTLHPFFENQCFVKKYLVPCTKGELRYRHTVRSLCRHFVTITGLNNNMDLGLDMTTTAASQWHNWVLSPVLVVDDHIYQRAQCSGELRWIWRQLLSRRAPSLPFDLLASLLPGLQFLLAMVIAFAFLQTNVLFHLHQGPVLSGLRLQGEGAMSLNSNNTYQVEERVYVIIYTDHVTIFFGLSYLRITTTFQYKNLFVWLSLHSWDAAIQYMLSDINLPQKQKPEALQTLKLRHSQPPVN